MERIILLRESILLKIYWIQIWK